MTWKWMCSLTTPKLLGGLWEIPTTVSSKFYIFQVGYLKFQPVQYFQYYSIFLQYFWHKLQEKSPICLSYTYIHNK